MTSSSARSAVLPLTLFLSVGIAGCAGGPDRLSRAGYPVGYVERGMASWYGPGFHGKRTANGESYDMYQMTAAHRTLPLGSVVRVRSLTNGRMVTVRINDRGPFAKNRILDVSQAAAQSLGMIGRGTDEIDLRVIDYRGQPGAMGLLYVQVGSFAELGHAQALASRLRQRYDGVRVQAAELPAGRRFRVQVGGYQRDADAEATASRIADDLDVDVLILRDDR